MKREREGDGGRMKMKVTHHEESEGLKGTKKVSETMLETEKKERAYKIKTQRGKGRRVEERMG